MDQIEQPETEVPMTTITTRPASYGIGLDPTTGSYYVMVNSRRAVAGLTCAAALAFVDHDRELRLAQLLVDYQPVTGRAPADATEDAGQ